MQECVNVNPHTALISAGWLKIFFGQLRVETWIIVGCLGRVFYNFRCRNQIRTMSFISKFYNWICMLLNFFQILNSYKIFWSFGVEVQNDILMECSFSWYWSMGVKMYLELWSSGLLLPNRITIDNDNILHILKSYKKGFWIFLLINAKCMGKKICFKYCTICTCSETSHSAL